VTLKFASLGSGSRGNALLVEFDATLLMVDCGLPRKIVEERLRTVGRDPRDVTAILVSHEHADHAQGVAQFTRRHSTPVWSTPGTAGAIDRDAKPRHMSCHRALVIESITVEPYPVPHDAREPCQFVFAAGGRRLGVLTDAGHVTPHMYARLAGCDALAIECNHDLDSLRHGPYPDSLKARVASRFGHLNNAQSTELLARVEHPGLQWVMGLHLSEQNNSPEHVRAALKPALDLTRYTLHLATQDQPTGWISVE
jgi:phosphoribosyl 1,2-cyclic phosphodiesterase